MRISIRAFGEVRSRLPKGLSELDVPASTPVARLLELLDLAPGLVGLVVVNGTVAPDGMALREGDTVEIVGVVGGGAE